MSFDLQLTNRRALVTGGTKGVGAAVVEALRNAGANVLATARSLPVQPTNAASAPASNKNRPRPYQCERIKNAVNCAFLALAVDIDVTT